MERGEAIKVRAGSVGRDATDHSPSPALLARVLDEMRDGVMVANAQGRLLFTNPAAQRLLRGDSPLTLRGGRVRCSEPADDRLLQRSIERACGRDLPGFQSVVIHQKSGIPIVVTVRCIREVAHDAHALLLATDPHREVASLAAALRNCFGLTPSEAEVAAAVGAGRSVAAIARQRGVAVDTVRTQLKRITAKLGCARQAQIAAIVNAIPPAHVLSRG